MPSFQAGQLLQSGDTHYFFHVSIVRATAGKTERIDNPVFSTKSLQT
jgi:hypothetical protein